MRIEGKELAHPVQASRVRLNVFQQPDGFLVTEERIGTVTVVATLGFFDSAEAALARLRLRAEELERQRYSPVAPAA